MKKQAMYLELAEYYDLIYYWKDYQKESNKIIELIKKHKKNSGKKLLEVGCGTGHHLNFLKKHFSCTGIDINSGILSVAKKKHKNIKFVKADMTSFDLKEKFDVITCLFSSIGYVKTYANLKKTINHFAAHLNEGGVLIIEPWFTEETYQEGWPNVTTYEDDKIKIARVNTSRKKGYLSIMDMHYLIAEKNKDVKHFVDRHELGLFSQEKTLKFLMEANLKGKFLKHGLMKDRGLYIAVKK